RELTGGRRRRRVSVAARTAAPPVFSVDTMPPFIDSLDGLSKRVMSPSLCAGGPMRFSGNTVDYESDEHRAYITLNRPDRLNAITAEMAREISDAVAAANEDESVRVIVLRGAGRAFCAGYDLKVYAESGEEHQDKVWDPIKDFRMMKANTDHFF